MLDVPPDLFRLAVIVAMGTALMVSCLIAGYRAAWFLGLDGGLGAVAGIAVAMSIIIGWFI